jgi:putative hemolysin
MRSMEDTALLIRPPREEASSSSAEAACTLRARWARHAEDVEAAQALRHRVFCDEMGAVLRPPPGTPAGLDADEFDHFCEHLIVTASSADAGERVVGTYRVLTPDAARMVGRLYADDEFDLSALAPLRPRMAELGRSCVDPQWRTGSVILMLWGQLVSFMTRNDLDLMIGCASVPMRDGGHLAASLWNRLRARHLAPAPWQVAPRLALPVEQLRGDLEVEPPPLIKGYLACGARLLGAPAWDADFGTADLPMMLDLKDLPGAYRRRFLRPA